MLHRQKAEQICLLLTGATWSFPLRHWATCFTPSFKEHNRRKSCLVYFLTLDILGAVTDLLHAGADRKHPGQDFFQDGSAFCQCVYSDSERWRWQADLAPVSGQMDGGQGSVRKSWSDSVGEMGGQTHSEGWRWKRDWWRRATLMGQKKGCVHKTTEPWRDTSA